MNLLFLVKKKTVKNLTVMLKKTGGRNLNGKITSYHRGQGHKSRHRNVDFKFNNNNLDLAIIRSFVYDPLRKAYIALICFRDNSLSYILATQKMQIGDIIFFNINTTIFQDSFFVDNAFKPDNLSIKNYTSNLQNFELGSFICNFKFNNSNKVHLSTRAAGTKSIILKKYKTHTLVKLPSNQLRLVSNNCIAVNGQISFSDFKFNSLKKAGESRHLGIKSKVRGVAKNPVDHPHGGGEGKTSGGRCSVTPWGILTKGYPTVRGKKRKQRLTTKFL